MKKVMLALVLVALTVSASSSFAGTFVAGSMSESWSGIKFKWPLFSSVVAFVEGGILSGTASHGSVSASGVFFEGGVSLTDAVEAGGCFIYGAGGLKKGVVGEIAPGGALAALSSMGGILGSLATLASSTGLTSTLGVSGGGFAFTPVVSLSVGTGGTLKIGTGTESGYCIGYFF